MKSFFVKLRAKIVEHKAISIAIVTLALVCVVVCAVVVPMLAGGHQHSYDDKWTCLDDEYHYHASLCGHDGKDKTPHGWTLSGETPSTCSTEGKKTYVCADCGKVKEESISKLSHEFEEVEKVNETCTEQGYTLLKCKNCGENQQVDFVGAIGHRWADATCKEAQKCLNCGTEGQPKLSHEWEKISETPADCEHGVIIKYKCKSCQDESESEETDSLGHTLQNVESKRELISGETCKYAVYAKCERCLKDIKTGETETHDYLASITKHATCVEDGEKTLTCTKCGNATTETVLKNENGHVWEEKGKTGNKISYDCAKCDAVKSVIDASTETKAELTPDDAKNNEINVNNVAFDMDDKTSDLINGEEKITLSAGTLTDSQIDGLGLSDEQKAQLGNGKIYDFEIKTSAGTLSDFDGGEITVTLEYTLKEGENVDNIAIWYLGDGEPKAIKATYFEVNGKGYVTFKTSHFSRYTVTRLTAKERCELYGHQMRETKVEKTCTSDGYTLKFCVRCGITEKADIQLHEGHKYQKTVTAPTCDENGSEQYECSECGKKYGKLLFATGHDWEVKSEKAPTCTESGYKEYVCGNDDCGKTYTETIAQKGHSLTETVIDATCTEDGYTEVKCGNCGYTAKKDYVKAKGHDEKTKVVEPTCTESGYTLKYCGRCEKEIEKTDIVKPNGHNMVNGVCSVCGDGCKHDYSSKVVTPTCEADGYTLYTCTKCGSEYKDNVVKTEGHDFVNGECTKCGKKLTTDDDYYLNMINSFVGECKLKIKLENFSVELSENILKKDTVIDSFTNGTVKQIDITEIYFSLDKDNNLLGKFKGVYLVEVENETICCELDGVLVGDNIYSKIIYDYTEYDGEGVVQTAYFKIALSDLEELVSVSLKQEIGINLEELQKYLEIVKDKLSGISDETVTEVNKFTVSVQKVVLDMLFDRSMVNNFYEYKLNLNNLKKYVDILADKSVATLIDDICGENTFKKLSLFVGSSLDKTVPEILESLKDYGIDYKSVLAVADEIAELATGEKNYASAMVNHIIAGFGQAKLKEIIAQYAGCIDTELTLVVQGVLKQLESSSLIDLILTYGEIDIEKADLVKNIKGAIDLAVNYLKGQTIAFTTDFSGKIVSGTLEFIDLISLVSKPGYSMNTNVSSETVTTLNGKIYFENGIDFDVKEYDDLIKETDAYEIKLEKNSEIDLLNGFVLKTDENGKIATVEYGRGSGSSFSSVPSYYCGDTYETKVYLYLDRYSMEVFKGINVCYNGEFCGDWMAYMLVGYETFTRYEIVRNVTYKWENGKYVLDRVEEIDRSEVDVGDEKTSLDSVNVIYSPSTKEIKYLEFSSEFTHDFQIVESESDLTCGGKIVQQCATCQFKITRDIKHAGELKKTYKLVGDSCEQGVIVINTCSKCNKQVNKYYDYSSWEHYYNDDNAKTYTLNEYGGTCGTTITVKECVCGKEHSVEVDDECDFNIKSVDVAVEHITEGQELIDGVFNPDSGSWSSINKVLKQFGIYDYYGVGCAYELKCAVTNPVKCDASVLLSVYWKKGDNCTAELHVTIEVKNGDKYETIFDEVFATHTYHNYKTTVSGNMWSDNYEKNAICVDCGSSYRYYKKTTQDGDSYSSIETEEFINNILDGETMKKRVTNITYNQTGETYLKKEETTRVYADGTESKYLYISSKDVYTGSISSPFGKAFIEKHRETNFATYDYYDESIVAYYKNHDYTLSSTSTNRYGENFDETEVRTETYEYDFSKNGCWVKITEVDFDGTTTIDRENVCYYWSYKTIEGATCSQPGKRVYICDVCGNESDDVDIIYPEHKWVCVDNNVYFCSVCGLENTNGVDGSIVMEDLTDYNGDYYTVGYFAWDSDLQFTQNVSLVRKNPNGGDYDEIILDMTAEDFDFSMSYKVQFFKKRVDELANARLSALGFDLNDYLVKFSFVPISEYGKFDYAITFSQPDSSKLMTECGTKILKVDGDGNLVITVKFDRDTECMLEVFSWDYTVMQLEQNGEYCDEGNCLYYEFKAGKTYTLTVNTSANVYVCISVEAC